jgi:hypothetical protein
MAAPRVVPVDDPGDLTARRIHQDVERVPIEVEQRITIGQPEDALTCDEGMVWVGDDGGNIHRCPHPVEATLHDAQGISQVAHGLRRLHQDIGQWDAGEPREEHRFTERGARAPNEARNRQTGDTGGCQRREASRCELGGIGEPQDVPPSVGFDLPRRSACAAASRLDGS